MTQTIQQLMQGNLLEVFNEHDPERRRAAISRIYAADVHWTDDEGVTVGHAALDAKAADLQAKIGSLQFVAAGPGIEQSASATWPGMWSRRTTQRRKCRVSTWRSSAMTSSQSCTPC
jgi:hypothetical protein